MLVFAKEHSKINEGQGNGYGAVRDGRYDETSLQSLT